MKLDHGATVRREKTVTSLAEVWIETLKEELVGLNGEVTSLAEVWIET